MILLDPPAWPAHGTWWSHLVSDTSLHELRAFARKAGLPDRGFDLDHYDAPARRHDELVAAGATAVDGRTLARRLARSGLRVPGHERTAAKRPALTARWAGLWDQPDRGVTDVGDELITRWAEPHRVYHGRLHLAAALDALDELVAASGLPQEDARAARLAVWFHDAVHHGDAGRDEERSAALALDLLTAATPTASADAAEVARLVLLTASHDPDPGDALGAVVSDADLAVLGGPPALYARYVHQVRAEYADVPDDAFRAGRATVIEQLLAMPTLYRTPQAQARWTAQATANLRDELHSLA